jgi:ABC-type sugar transport system substrate-binding protein
MTGADGSPDNAPLIAAFKTTASRIGVTPQLLAPGRGIDAGAAIRTAFAGAADAVCIVVGSDADRESARQAAMSIRRPVIAIEDRLEGSPVRDALRDAFSGIVGPDAVTAGRMAGQALLPLWGHAQVAVLAATDADFARASGFSSSVSGALAVVATLRVRADGGDVAAQVGKLIQRYPHIGALFCTNVDAAKGALGAIAAAGLTRKVAIVVAGSTSELRARRAAGDIVILIDRRPDLIGRQAAELAVGLLDGRFDPHEEVVTTQQIVR